MKLEGKKHEFDIVSFCEYFQVTETFQEWFKMKPSTMLKLRWKKSNIFREEESDSDSTLINHLKDFILKVLEDKENYFAIGEGHIDIGGFTILEIDNVLEMEVKLDG